jgi:hypothetical protein
MASPAQIAANRANARKSTGPRSVEGKSASRFNALKHGIDAASIVIPGEDPAEYDALVAEYQREYRPRSASESFQVETMIRADWHKRRLEQVEAELYRTVLSESPGKSLAAALLSGTPAAKLLARVQRQITAFERTWNRALNEFRKVRALSVENYIHDLCAPPAELASFRQSAKNRAPEPPAAPNSTPNWPPIDEKTGQPAFFVG